MNTDGLAPIQRRRIARVAKAKNSGKTVTFTKVPVGGPWKRLEYIAVIDGGPSFVIFNAAGESQYKQLYDATVAEYTMLTRKKAPSVNVLRRIAEFAGWQGDGPNSMHSYYCEFCLMESEAIAKIPHAADCPVPPFRAWVKSLEQEGVE